MQINATAERALGRCVNNTLLPVGHDHTSQQEYWKTLLSGYEPVARLNLIKPATPNVDEQSGITFFLAPQLTKDLNQFAHRHKCAVPHILQCAWMYVLGIYADRDDIVVGVAHPLFPRDKRGARFPVRIQWDRQTTLLQLLKKICYQMRIIGHSVVAASVVNQHDHLLKFGYHYQRQFSRTIARPFDLSFEVTHYYTLVCRLLYKNAVYCNEHMHNIVEHLCNVLSAIVMNPWQRASDVTVLSSHERAKVQRWNDTQFDYPYKTLPQLVNPMQIAEEKIAIIEKNREIAYGQLHQNANQIAHYLLSQDFKPNALIAIYLEPSIEQVTIVLAIIKAGLCFLPVDTRYPENRLIKILEDSQPVLCILSKQSINSAKLMLIAHCIEAERLLNMAQHHSTSLPVASVKESDLAYVIYTSGSTGHPKGVANTQQGISNTLSWLSTALQYTADDRILYKTSFSFDVAVTEYVFPLTIGASIVIPAPDVTQDMALLLETINEYKISSVNFVPCLLAVFLQTRDVEYCYSLKKIILAGEKMPLEYAHLAQQKLKVDLYNLYGPSEAAVFCSYYHYTRHCVSHTVPIGQAVQNMQLLIMNQYQQLLPLCLRGELYLAGRGLAAQYYKNPQLTHEKFIDTAVLGPPQRMYKTGDYVRYCQDNTLEFIERDDGQVKISGNRVELTEIEYYSLLHPNVHQIMVMTHQTNHGSAMLVAYVGLAQGKVAATNQAMACFLRRSLPDCMIPKVWMWLDALPTNVNGKIDVAQLPDPFAKASMNKGDEQATSLLEKQLLAIWRKVLGNTVTLEDNFFDLGGDSITCMAIVAQVCAQQMVITPKYVFTHPTVRQLAQCIQYLQQRSRFIKRDFPKRIKQTSHMAVDTIIAEIRKKNPQVSQQHIVDVYPVAPVQRSILFHSLNQQEAYVEQLVFAIEGEFNIERSQTIWDDLCQRHALLRAGVISLKNDHPQHVIFKSCVTPFALIDWRKESKATQLTKLQSLIQTEKSQPFDLARPPLLRVKLVQLTAQYYYMIITDHHIISDGWSRSILVDEFLRLYNGEASIASLPPVVSFKQVIQQLHGLDKEQAQVYWENILQGSCGPSKLCIDKKEFNDYLPGSRMLKCQYRLAACQVQRLKTLSMQCQVTLNALLHSAWAMLLQQYSGNNDCQYGTVVSLRSIFPKLQRCYANHMCTIPVRFEVNQQLTVQQLLAMVHLQFLESQEQPIIGMCRTKKALKKHLYDSLFNYMVIFENQPVCDWANFANNHFAIKNVEFHDDTHYPLTLFFIPDQHELLLEFHYQTEHFAKVDIQCLMTHLVNVLAHMQTPETRVAQINLYSYDEMHKILHQYNQTSQSYGQALTASEHFEQQVLKTPDNMALICGEQQLTYTQLNQTANQLARALLQQGVVQGDIVAILQQRHVNYLLTILALHKMGAAYLPLDVKLPPCRLSAIMQQCHHAWVIVDHALQSQLDQQSQTHRYIVMESLLQQSQSLSALNLNQRQDPESLAYVLFTSGSTGIPKGVLIEHKALVSRLLAIQQLFNLQPAERWLALSTFTFDTSVMDYYLPWVRGDQVILATEQQIYDPRQLIQLFEQYAITIAQATPTLWQLIVDAGWSPSKLRHVVCGGEALSSKLALAIYQSYAHRKLDKKEPKIWNLYGSTETTIWSIAYLLDINPCYLQAIPMGQPIANTQVYVLDRKLQPVATNIIGELYIGGAGLAREYLNDAALTAEKFITTPWDASGKTRLYRTGDLARWLPSGQLQCHGRCDDQVKWHGVRIELHEINILLEQHPLVKRAVTRLVQHMADASLVSFVCLQETALLFDGDVNLQLQQWCAVYDDIYKNNTKQHASMLNTAGWISVFTRKPLPQAMMARWRDNIVQRIEALQPQRILEIGCGTGMLLFPLSQRSQGYAAIDPSVHALDYIDTKMRALPNFSTEHVCLQRAYAHQLPHYPHAMDTVILNSVVQYFPSVDYFVLVLRQVIAQMTPTGKIVIGDVRSYAHVDLLYASYLSAQHASLQQDEVFYQLFHALETQENELLFHPDYFYHLKTVIPEIASVSIELKQANNDNEVSTFRYDVVLHLGEAPALATGLHWQDFQQDKLQWATLAKQLALQPQALAIQNIPNQRFHRYVTLLNTNIDLAGLSKTSLTVALDVLTAAQVAIAPSAIYRLAERYGYRAYCTWSVHNPYCFDVVFYGNDLSLMEVSHLCCNRQAVSAACKPLTSLPLRQWMLAEAEKRLFQYMQKNLPPNMLPSAWRFLQAFPLTASGKIDNNALVAMHTLEKKEGMPIELPTTPVEQTLLRIWQTVLKNEAIGINDNFFHSGGHSLKAIQLIQYVRDELQMELSLASLFMAPTIRQLAAKLQSTACCD